MVRGGAWRGSTLAGGRGGSSAYHTSGTSVQEGLEAALRRGLAEVESVVPGFDPLRFSVEAMDILFRVQSAKAARDLQWVERLLTAEVRQELQEGLDVLKAERRITRLENIVVRCAEIRGAWVESRKAFVTVCLLASLLDYTVEEEGGRLVAGSRENRVKFEEYWSFVWLPAESSWRLNAIRQVV
ncbi:MAG: TIM44-like domain-containing protein [candidate division NC10 bacterium]|nr:TIM44-like domain-containing protein [candidate division NC10 bacterium]